MNNNNLTLKDIRTLGLAALGGALEFYDFIIFIFFAKTISELFFPASMPDWMAQLQVYGIFASGYIARPIGGVIMAHFGDLIGRKKMFALSVFLMSLPTLLIGFLPTYASIGIAAPILLLLLRIVQGIAIGGEVPAAWVFVSEHVPKGRIGFACASLTSGLTLGILLGSLTGRFIYANYHGEELYQIGWRIPFLIGGVFGLLAVWLRRWLHETPVFESMKQRKELTKDIPLKVVLKNHKQETLISFLVTWMLTAAIMVIILMTPNIAQTSFGIAPDTAFLGNNYAAFMLVFGCLLGGLLADKIGYHKALCAGAVALPIMSYVLYSSLIKGGSNFVLLYALTGLFVGVVGIVPTVLIHSFPAHIRFSGVSFSYNMSYAFFGGLTPPLISYMSTTLAGYAPAHYVAFTSIIAFGIGLRLITSEKT